MVLDRDSCFVEAQPDTDGASVVEDGNCQATYGVEEDGQED